MDRELSRCDAEALSRHLALCRPCAARADMARGLAKVLRSHLDRAPAPERLLSRLHSGGAPAMPSRPRPSSYFFAAAVALLVFPLVADTPARRGTTTEDSGNAAIAPRAPLTLVSKRMTGTFVCVQCEARQEAGLCPIREVSHVLAFCADNGEIWRLMTRDPRFGEAAFGRTATLEGTAFPQSGFLRANRVGY